MFPVVKVAVRGLDPAAMYTLLLEFIQIEQHRLKNSHHSNYRIRVYIVL